MMITELESPFSRRTKQKILKAQEKHISVSEALRLTTKTLGFGMDEPEPDYGENEEEPDYEPDYEDEEDVNTGSYKLVNVDNQMPTTNGVLDFDQLNPEQIRKTMRHHFNETRRKRRSTRRAFDPDGRRYDADDDGYSQRYTDYDRDNRVRGDEIDLEDEDPDANKAWKKNTWKDEYFRRIRGNDRERTVRNRRRPERRDSQIDSDFDPPRRSNRQGRADGNGYRTRRSAHRDPRFVQGNEFERMFSERLMRMNGGRF